MRDMPERELRVSPDVARSLAYELKRAPIVDRSKHSLLFYVTRYVTRTCRASRPMIGLNVASRALLSTLLLVHLVPVMRATCHEGDVVATLSTWHDLSPKMGSDSCEVENQYIRSSHVETCFFDSFFFFFCHSSNSSNSSKCQK